ncbi:hypothetical protein ES703_90258 [subsurface metagenome]
MIMIWLIGYVTDGLVCFTGCGKDVSISQTAQWVEMNLSEECPDGIMAFILAGVYNAACYYGLRKHGSGEDIYRTAYYYAPNAIVELDADKKLEGKIELADADFWVRAYAVIPAAPPGLENKSANMGAKMVAEKMI